MSATNMSEVVGDEALPSVPLDSFHPESHVLPKHRHAVRSPDPGDQRRYVQPCVTQKLLAIHGKESSVRALGHNFAARNSDLFGHQYLELRFCKV